MKSQVIKPGTSATASPTVAQLLHHLIDIMPNILFIINYNLQSAYTPQLALTLLACFWCLSHTEAWLAQVVLALATFGLYCIRQVECNGIQ